MEFVNNMWARCRHLLPLALYLLLYLLVFAYVESRPAYHMHLLSSRFDHLIPFCEVFVVPYYLWFVYMVFGVLFMGIVEKDRTQYNLLAANLVIGMTLFLIISYVWPNGHTLRPAIIPRDNVFTRMVTAIYRSDTSTNVLPSIHVFNTIAMHTAIKRSTVLKNHPLVVRGSFILAVLIVLSTMFIKQHTVIDVVVAFGLNTATWYLLYQQKAFAAKHMHGLTLHHNH